MVYIPVKKAHCLPIMAPPRHLVFSLPERTRKRDACGILPASTLCFESIQQRDIWFGIELYGETELENRTQYGSLLQP